MKDIEIPNELWEIIERQVELVTPVNGSSCFMSGGENGPYFDLETPVRNTAHWLIVFSIVYRKSGETKYKNAAESLLSFLLGTQKFQRNGVYIHRQKGGKDWSNGVIGQAWVIEALYVAGKLLGSTAALKMAKEASNIFLFEEKVSAWSRINAANGKSSIDYTLNHQLWYASTRIEAEPQSRSEIDAFLTSLDSGSFRIREDGLICHILYSSSLKAQLLKYRYLYFEKRNRSSVIEKEIGYHLFNLYPLARLYHHLPDHSFFKNSKFIKALDYSISPGFLKALEKNKYSFPYNSPAFEIPLVLDTFKEHFLSVSSDGLESIKKSLIQKQLKKTFDGEAKLLALNCPDSLTLSARIYEYMLGCSYKNIIS